MSKQENTVLKKAGIVVAVAAAGVLAVSPLAFAGEKGGDMDHGHGHGHGHGHANHSKTVNSPTCTFENGSDSRSEQDVESNSLLGAAALATNVTAPVTTQGNAPIGSCNNFSDLIDLDSNNDTKTVTDTKTVDNSKTVTTDETNTSSFTSVFEGILPF
jgi:hypothetical protein